MPLESPLPQNLSVSLSVSREPTWPVGRPLVRSCVYAIEVPTAAISAGGEASEAGKDATAGHRVAGVKPDRAACLQWGWRHQGSFQERCVRTVVWRGQRLRCHLRQRDRPRDTIPDLVVVGHLHQDIAGHNWVPPQRQATAWTSKKQGAGGRRACLTADSLTAAGASMASERRCGSEVHQRQFGLPRFDIDVLGRDVIASVKHWRHAVTLLFI